jgi:hypothetical protein
MSDPGRNSYDEFLAQADQANHTTPASAPSKPKPKPSSSKEREITTFLDPNWSWTDISTWPLSVKFFPVFVALVGVFVGVYVQDYFKKGRVDG